MSDVQKEQIPIKKAKERSYKTVNYSHECPDCGDETDGYDVSCVGDVLGCVCGEQYEVVK